MVLFRKDETHNPNVRALRGRRRIAIDGGNRPSQSVGELELTGFDRRTQTPLTRVSATWKGPHAIRSEWERIAEIAPRNGRSSITSTSRVPQGTSGGYANCYRRELSILCCT